MPASSSFGSVSARVPVAVTVAVDGTEESIFAKVLPPYAEVTQLHADLNIVSDTLGATSHTLMAQYGMRVVYGELPVDDAYPALSAEDIAQTLFPVSGADAFKGVSTAVVGTGLLGETDVSPVAYSKAFTLWSRVETLSLPSNAILIGDAVIALADKVKIRSYPNKRRRGFKKPRKESFKILIILMNTDVIATASSQRQMMWGDTTGDYDTLADAFRDSLADPEAGINADPINDIEDWMQIGRVEAGLTTEAILNVSGHISLTAEYYKRTPDGRKHWRPV